MDDIIKRRTIQEYVPGKQITLCHIIAKPDVEIYKKLGLNDEIGQSVGILTITPAEGSIIAADTCSKAARIKVGFLDRFSGSVVITGEVYGVESAFNAVISLFNQLGFDTAGITRS